MRGSRYPPVGGPRSDRPGEVGGLDSGRERVRAGNTPRGRELAMSPTPELQNERRKANSRMNSFLTHGLPGDQRDLLVPSFTNC